MAWRYLSCNSCHYSRFELREDKDAAKAQIVCAGCSCVFQQFALEPKPTANVQPITVNPVTKP
jgi:transcription initiation factor TFIIIB Brf1 subunit/transcription initiation factor TFIIB